MGFQESGLGGLLLGLIVGWLVLALGLGGAVYVIVEWVAVITDLAKDPSCLRGCLIIAGIIGLLILISALWGVGAP